VKRIINATAIKIQETPLAPAGASFTESQARNVSTRIRTKVRITKEYVDYCTILM
jgi:hypothetical protein